MEAGIDSLAATELSSRLRAATGLLLSPTLVFEQPTPRAIAAHVLEQLAGAQCIGGPVDVDHNAGHGGIGSLALLPPLEPLAGGVRPGEAYRVSWNQSQLLTVHAGGGGAEAAYNMPLAHWLRGPLAVVALRAALAALVARHAVLRTTFEVDADGGCVQRVHATESGKGGDGGSNALLRETEAPSTRRRRRRWWRRGGATLLAGARGGRGAPLAAADGAPRGLRRRVDRAAAVRELSALYTLASGGAGEAAAAL
eukprot:scaffold43398_cov61-Phaeocystis_antarctica.AAC.1